MTTRSDADGERGAETAAAWLVVDGGASPPVGLSVEDCLAVAGTLLSTMAGRCHESGPPSAVRESLMESLADRLAVVADRVPALAAWLAAVSHGPTGPAASAGATEHGDVPLLSRFAASLILSGDERSPTDARERRAGREAVVLRDAVQLALAHGELRHEFDRAVAEARLEAMRELAYGAGHEINNPLANIATRAQALLLEETDPERRRRLSTIVDQSFRARDMIGGLMLFARPPKPRREAADVGGIIAAVIESVRGQANARGGRLEYSPPPVPEAVCVDRVQIEEAIRVVVVNALEAVAVGGRVVLEVNSQPIEFAGMCQITVSDDGRGLSFEAARRAFDPFYSGREAGRGAGLGLPKAWRLVESSGGRVLLDSRPGQGTRVSILLPKETPVDAPAPAART